MDRFLKMVFLEILESANYAGFCSDSHIPYKMKYWQGILFGKMHRKTFWRNKYWQSK